MKREAINGIMLTLLLIGINVQPVKAQEEGLIAYLPFNGNADDESGNNHDGTVYGATLATDRFGNPNSAYSFDGIDDYVEIPHDADFDFGTVGFTVSAWIKTNATTTSGSGRDEILSKGDATISGFAISMENNKAAFWVGPSGEFFGSSVLNDGEWHQIVGTRDDSGNVVLYVDGMLESTGINNENVDTGYSVFMGKHGTVSESYFDGLIDDVKIYNRAVAPHRVFLSPSSQVGYDIPGAAANFTIEVINRMGSDDSFDLSVSGNAWPTSLSTDNTGIIPDGESVSFTAEVEIPALASPGDTDTATITATSVSDPTITDTTSVTTRAIEEGEYVDDFSTDTGLWTYWGSAYRDEENSYVVLTEPLNHQIGIIWLKDEVTSSFSAQFRYKIGGGSGADGLVLMFYKTKDYEPIDFHSNLGFSGWPDGYAPGYGIEFDGWLNGGEPSANHIALIKDRTDNHLAYVNDARTEDNEWHQVRVTVESNTVDVEVDGDHVLAWEGEIDRTFGGVGFGAATGGATNWHIIDDVHISIVKYEHELTVSLDPPTFLEPGDSSLLNATVYNRGLSNETDIELFLLINGTVVNNVTIPELVNGTSYTIDYLWSPTVEATYNVTAYAPPVPGENITINNVNSRYVIVQEYFLVSWWTGDGNALDIWDGNHGTLVNGATFDQGLVAQAFSLDGVDDYVDLGTGENLNFGTNDFTIDLWVNFVTTDGEQVLIEKWVQKEVSLGWTLTKLADNVLRLALSGPEVCFDVTPPSISTNTWLHVAVTRSGDTFALYWNGAALGVFDCAYNLNSTSSLKMGHRGNPNDTPGSQDWRGFYLNGLIDEVEIYNRALSSQEIQDIYNAGSPPARYEHELTVYSEAPDFLEPGESSLLNATVYNRGLSNETDVELFLLINGTEVESVLIPELLSGSSYTLSHLWTPTVKGIYNVTAYAPPVPGETFTVNNVATANITVIAPRGQIFRHGRTESGPIPDINPFNPATPGVYFGPYESLAYADTLTGEIKPLLAESWSWVDDYTFEIKLRPEARWSDGSPVTAEDVAFSLDSLSDPKYGGARRAEVESYSAVDERTVRVQLREEYPHNSRVLGVLVGYYIIPKARWSLLLEEYGEDIVSYTDLEDLEAIITSYPYRPIYAGPERVICERVDDYWGNQIGWFHHPKYVEDFFYGSNEAVVRDGYEGHGCDWSGVTFNEPQWFKDHKDFMGCWDIDAEPENMFMHEPSCLVITPNYNYTEEEGVYIFRELWLRQALAYATNAEASLESGWSMCGNLYPPTFLNPDLADYDLYVNEDVLTENFDTEIRGGHLCIAYSPEKAVEILQEYCTGSVEEGWTTRDTGVKLGDPAWTIQAVNGWADVMIEAKVIAKGWSDIGIPTEPVYPEFGTWMSNYATGNYIWTQMWSWIRLAETANPISDTFYDNFVLEPAVPNIWFGSPGHYPLFFDGNHPPLPDTADEVKELTMSLYEMETGSDEYIATVKQLQSILVPQVPFILPHGKSTTIGFVTDRWVSWPTASDPYEHRLDAVEPATDLLIKGVRPKCIETTSFSLSSDTVEAGKPVTASVTLENTADYDQEYQVEICEGAAEVGPGPDPIAWKIATVPALGSATVELSVTIDEVGTYVLTVDDWRIGKYDPGEPIERTLVVSVPEHELAVTLDAPNFLKLTDSSLLNVTVHNRGLSNETDVGLFLLINGTEVESVLVPELLTGESYTVNYSWTATVEATYNVTAYAPPVPGENITINNIDSRYVIVEEYFTLHFRACIDGSDWVYIRGNEVWYVHRNYQFPGIHTDCPDNATYINGDPWYPEWPDDYGYDDYGQRSLNTYTDLYPPLFNIVSFSVIEARGSITIDQYPSIENNYTAIILLNDDSEGGASSYGFELSYKTGKPPTVETTDETGNAEDEFRPEDNVYINGSRYCPSKTFDLHVVEDTDWSDGVDIPDRVSGTETSVTTDESGNIPAGTVAWNGPLTPGKYDIVIDVNGNGVYNEGIDALDDRDIEVTAGFFVIPEYALGTILGLVACLAALVVFKHKRLVDGPVTS